MSRRKRTTSGTMLDLWRPPQDAGEPIGCLTTTYTFNPGLFDEQCLARFLGIESEPNREDLAFLLERESRLGSVYAGVLVDYTMAGVEHSLRWDVLPVRVPSGKQHSKLSLLVWAQAVRIIVTSANLTEYGYRFNHEVTASIDLFPWSADLYNLNESIDFLRKLLLLVPGADARIRVVQRASEFLGQVEKRTVKWVVDTKHSNIRQQLVFTLPQVESGNSPRSSLEEAMGICRKRGGSPTEIWSASPFFDINEDAGIVVASLCKMMARGKSRELTFCVPAISGSNEGEVYRLAAPKTLITIPPVFKGDVYIEILPGTDSDNNARPWHAKMLALMNDQYSAVMVGSSNLTTHGMGVVVKTRNAEANLVTVVDRQAYAREIGMLESIWPDMGELENPNAAEWMGARPEEDEENQESSKLPAGFVSATYHAGDIRQIELRLEPDMLPRDWIILACIRPTQELLTANMWHGSGKVQSIKISWEHPQPPDKLEVQWDGQIAFMPLNVEDSSTLPKPAQLENMTADDMLRILAATDPSAAFRTWASHQTESENFDSDLDSATPIDLDPLQRYDLQETFLHRIRNRSRVFARLRAKLQLPIWGIQSLEWRLRGMVGIKPLAELYLKDFLETESLADEALLTLSDFLIVLGEVDYQAAEGMLTKIEFDSIYGTFLLNLATSLNSKVESRRDIISEDMFRFWNRVVERCVN